MEINLIRNFNPQFTIHYNVIGILNLGGKVLNLGTIYVPPTDEWAFKRALNSLTSTDSDSFPNSIPAARKIRSKRV